MSRPLRRLSDLTLDPTNANLGSERGTSALDRSLERYGAGRGVVVDRNGIVIGGNKTVELAVAQGLALRLVPVRGDTLVVAQRMDLDLTTDPAARELAYADNRVQELSLTWSPDQLQADVEALGLPETLFTADELARLTAPTVEGRTSVLLFGSEAEYAAWAAFAAGKTVAELDTWVAAQVAALSVE